METGHVKQVATFEKFVEFCNAHGTMFNPSKTTVQLTALNNLLKSAQQAIEQVKIAQTDYESAMNARKDAFEALPSFMTRIVNALAASEAPDSAIADAYTIIYKISGWQGRSNPPLVNPIQMRDRFITHHNTIPASRCRSVMRSNH